MFETLNPTRSAGCCFYYKKFSTIVNFCYSFLVTKVTHISYSLHYYCKDDTLLELIEMRFVTAVYVFLDYMVMSLGWNTK